MVDVQKDYQRIQEAGGELVVVTMGNVKETDRFRRLFDAQFTFLADPDRTAYRAYGLDRGTLRQIIGPGVWLPGLRALARGGAGKPIGDTRQMPGSFIIDRKGIIRHTHYPAHQADRPPQDEVIRLLEGVAQQ